MNLHQKINYKYNFNLTASDVKYCNNWEDIYEVLCNKDYIIEWIKYMDSIIEVH